MIKDIVNVLLKFLVSLQCTVIKIEEKNMLIII